MAGGKKEIRTELEQKESYAMIRLLSVISEFNNSYQQLQKRAGDAGIRKEYDELQKTQVMVINKLLRTVPPQKLELLLATLDNIRLEVSVKPEKDDKGNSSTKQKEKKYAVVPTDAINQLLDFFLANNCMCCSGEKDEEAGCGYKKMLESIYSYKIELEEKDCCKFSGLSCIFGM